MRWLCLLAIAGCVPEQTILYWNLDASACTRAGAETVTWVYERSQTVVDEIGFPCRDGEGVVPLYVDPYEPTRDRVGLLDAHSSVLATCVPVARRGGLFCDFAVP